MDVFELPLPAAVSVSKLLIAEGFGRQGVSVGESKAQELKTSVSICGKSAATRGSDSSGDVICAVPNLEVNSVSRAKKADVRFCKLDSSLANFGGEDISKQITIKNRNGSPSSLPKYTAKQLHQKSGKTSKNSSPCSKKQKAEQVEGSMSQLTTKDAHNTPGRHGSNLMRSTFSEKSHVVGHKHGADGRRGDRRNFKAPTKTKFDPFCPKIGSMGTNSAAGGENILGIYGLRSDIHDVTKHVDELSLNDILDGSYKGSSIYQGRGKKATNANGNLVHMVRNACSVLQIWRAAHEQNTVELDSSSNKKMDASLLSSGFSMTSGTACGKRDSCLTDLASSSKDTCSNPGAPTTSSTSLLYKPCDILERLSLPPAKDLDSLLLDSSKPMLSSKGTIDLRSSKSFSHGSRLPPFSWSHCPSGLSKTIVDTGRFSANRSTSQGRWVRIGSIARYLGGSPSSFSNLESLISNQESLIKGSDAKTSHPSSEHKLPQRFQDSFDGQLNFGFTVGNLLKVSEAEGILKHCENDVALISSSPNNLKEKCKGRNILNVNSSCSCCSSNKCSIGESDGFQSHSHTVDNSMRGYSPRLLVAAQTLYEMSRHSTVQNKSEGKLRSFKKPSQRVTKSCKSELMTVKSEDTPIKSEIRPSDPINIMDQMITSKKLKFSTNNKRKDGHTNIGREPIKWSISTSSRSSPYRAENSDTKQSNADNVKLLGVMPPSKRTPERSCNNDQKIRKTVAIDWGRGRSRME